jgi:hypothetical protein
MKISATLSKAELVDIICRHLAHRLAMRGHAEVNFKVSECHSDIEAIVEFDDATATDKHAEEGECGP